MSRKIPVAIKEEIMKKIDELTVKKIVAKVNEPTDWISTMVVVKKPQYFVSALTPVILTKRFKAINIHNQQLKIFYPCFWKKKCFHYLIKKTDFDK